MVVTEVGDLNSTSRLGSAGTENRHTDPKKLMPSWNGRWDQQLVANDYRDGPRVTTSMRSTPQGWTFFRFHFRFHFHFHFRFHLGTERSTRRGTPGVGPWIGAWLAYIPVTKLMPTTSCSELHTSDIIVFDVPTIPFKAPRKKLTISRMRSLSEQRLRLDSIPSLTQSWHTVCQPAPNLPRGGPSSVAGDSR